MNFKIIAGTIIFWLLIVGCEEQKTTRNYSEMVDSLKAITGIHQNISISSRDDKFYFGIHNTQNGYASIVNFDSASQKFTLRDQIPAEKISLTGELAGIGKDYKVPELWEVLEKRMNRILRIYNQFGLKGSDCSYQTSCIECTFWLSKTEKVRLLKDSTCISKFSSCDIKYQSDLWLATECEK